MQPLVSIIIPCYNTERYIGEAIESALNQTYRNIELIVVNDGSTDRSGEIILEYEQRDQRIKYFKQPNAGVSAARNAGIAQAKGEIISFLDSDDAWEPENLSEKTAVLLADSNIDWVFSDCYLADPEMNKIKISEAGSDVNILESLLTRSGDVIHAPSNIVLKRNCLSDPDLRFDTRLSTSADWDFCIQLASHNLNGKRIAKPLWKYRLLNNSMSRNISTMERDNLLICKKHIKNNTHYSLGFRMRCLSNNYFILGGCWWVDGRNKFRGLLFILRSVLAYPPNVLKILNKISPYYLTSPSENSFPVQKEILIRLDKKRKQQASGKKRSKNPVNILLFHRIHPGSDPLWNPITPHAFENILIYLKKNYDIVLLEDHLESPASSHKKPLCAITFDDGYKDYLEYALPILHKHKLPASMYVVSDCISKNLPPWTYILNHAFINTSHLSLDIDTTLFPDELKQVKWKNKTERIDFARKLSPYLKSMPNYRRSKIYSDMISQLNDVEAPGELMMSWKEIKELLHNNTAIGSHTETHPVLSEIMHNEKLFSELTNSANEIEKHTGKRPVSIAYPFGLYNSNVKAVAQQTGYKFAFSTIPLPYQKDLFDDYEIPRTELFNESHMLSKMRVNGTMLRINTMRNIFSS